ncbi:vacuolar protein sorting-associated protein 51 [Paragonimus westermani]|uniref:Vacuolar protein sorting-associated protein 51 homolog n=1 Tax=Paragonimus westermani TaxID=34504 RepID=A0A5J4NUS7_9TREM|nr:vacuolar protein sorting-associated protein 51 [Paragonimus westermani]
MNLRCTGMKEDTYRKTAKEKLLQAGSHPNHSEAAASPVHEDSQTDVFNIDGPTFHAQSYMDKHLREKDLSDLMLEEKVLTEQIRTLDSEMQTLMYDNYSKFISATDTIRMQQACSETPLLVRAVDRFHSRVQLFTRTFTSAIHSMVTATTDDLTGDQYEMVPRSNENLPEIYGQQTRQLCERFLRRALDLVHSVAQARTEFYRTKLCQSAVDSITDLRQQLVSPSLQIGPGQVFLNPDNTFTSRACFAEQFCLLQLREQLIVGHLKFLLDFLDDLAKTAASRVPSPILLLLAKLCYSWANSGTLGHLLTLPEELLSHGNRRWSSSTNLTSPVCQISSVPSVPFDPNSPPTTSKGLTDSYRQVSTQLLVAFVRLEGTNLAQLLRKSVEARDWLKNLEPRSVRSVVKRVIEDLSMLDRQIGQLFPSYSRGHKDRLSDTRSVRSGHTSSLRPTGSSHFLDKVSRPGSTGLPVTSNELDPSLATQLRRLFTQRVDIFASVEANRDSLLLGVIKIGLKVSRFRSKS